MERTVITFVLRHINGILVTRALKTGVLKRYITDFFLMQKTALLITEWLTRTAELPEAKCVTDSSENMLFALLLQDMRKIR